MQIECTSNTVQAKKWCVLIWQNFTHFFTTLKEKLSPLKIPESLSGEKMNSIFMQLKQVSLYGDDSCSVRERRKRHGKRAVRNLW